MKTTAIFAVLVLLIPALPQANAQADEVPNTMDVLKINLPRGIISYEFSTFQRQAIHLQGGFRPVLLLNAINNDLDARFFIDPALRGQYRFYYNMIRRAEQGKRVALNSADYIAPSAEVWYSRQPVRGTTVRDQHRYIYNTGVVWGAQRNLANRLSIDYQIGPGITFARGTDISTGGRVVPSVQPAIIGGVSLGLWLNKAQ
jgi:hypothetical protein